MATNVTEKLRISKIMNPEWLETLDHYLTKDGYVLETNSEHYATYRRGYFWEDLHQIVIKPSSLYYATEEWREGQTIAKVTDLLTVTTNVPAALVIAMLSFAGAFAKPPFNTAIDPALFGSDFSTEQFTGLALPV